MSAYKNLGYREVKPSEMIDAAYLWAGKGGLKEEVNQPDVIRLNIPSPNNFNMFLNNWII